VVGEKVREFQEAGLAGIGLYLACFGPALEIFSRHWPLERGTARQQPKGYQNELFGPWFPADEALKLARVAGLDFDQQVRNVACAVSGDDVTLWDSQTRATKSKLISGPQAPMFDRLHEAAYTVRFQNTEAARNRLESLRLMDDPTLMTALEALLNVLPPGPKGAPPRGKKKPDPSLEGAASGFEALGKLRRLAFAEKVPEPKRPEHLILPTMEGVGETDGEE
jgi:hypothetical protein